MLSFHFLSFPRLSCPRAFEAGEACRFHPVRSSFRKKEIVMCRKPLRRCVPQFSPDPDAALVLARTFADLCYCQRKGKRRLRPCARVNREVIAVVKDGVWQVMMKELPVHVLTRAAAKLQHHTCTEAVAAYMRVRKAAQRMYRAQQTRQLSRK